MPSKNKRAATRQAKLSQRRRRRGGGRKQRTDLDSTTDVATASAVPGERSSTPVAAAARTQAPAAAGQSSPAGQRPARRVAAAPRARTRAAQNRAATYEPLPMYAYLGSELKRIGAVTAVMAVALAALTVLLGQG